MKRFLLLGAGGFVGMYAATYLGSAVGVRGDASKPPTTTEQIIAGVLLAAGIGAGALAGLHFTT